MTKKQITLRLNEATLLEAKDIAESENRTISSLLIDLVMVWLSSEKYAQYWFRRKNYSNNSWPPSPWTTI